MEEGLNRERFLLFVGDVSAQLMVSLSFLKSLLKFFLVVATFFICDNDFFWGIIISTSIHS